MKTTILKRLFAVAGNTCAFPDCTTRLVEEAVIVGEVCHIRAQEPGGPRYDANYPDRDAFENLVVMCGVHHKNIDTKPDKYPVEMLGKIKRDHEQRFEQPSDQALERITVNINEGSIITSHNQQGGQTAHQITNIYHEPPKTPLPALVPIIDCHMTNADNNMGIDYYDFRVNLRNESDFTVREFRLEVEIPRKYASSATISAAEVPCPNKPDVKCYRRTQVELRAFQLYPDKEWPESVLSLDFLLRHNQYKDVNESIAVRLYSGDALLSAQEYPLGAYRNKDRMVQLGLS